MQTPYLVAAILSAVTGLVHSAFGEILIFRHLRNGSLVPALGAPPLRERHVRIIWATWHLATLFGWAFAGLLLQLALGHTMSASLVAGAIVFANLGGAVLVLVGTKGRHPGWIALSIVAALTWLGAGAV
ncbi:hypothetical protein [Pseudomonas sp. CC6-YY-74]|uniref:hypothetical protein n=1 Tax=Pseudomonas sp. CC6-YY-74 TaxID=1930532 RepID=UPI0009A22BA1|nr:hypothetical protein [Pseudomonas sp. CC6-YY-74]